MGSASVFFATSQTAYLNTRPELVSALRKARKENKPWQVQIECEKFYSHRDWRTPIVTATYGRPLRETVVTNLGACPCTPSANSNLEAENNMPFADEKALVRTTAFTM
jgi:hypothetical protein